MIYRGVCFNHDVLHEGTAVKGGTKWVLRTDIMVRKRRFTRSKVAHQREIAVSTRGVLAFPQVFIFGGSKISGGREELSIEHHAAKARAAKRIH
jgi:hypothetical protein